MLNKLKEIVKMYKHEIIYTALTCLMFVFLCFSFKQCIEYKNINTNNIKALTDSLNYYKTKNGKLVAETTTLYTSINDLKNINDSLYFNIKDIGVKNPNNVVYINSTIENKKCDTLFLSIHDTLQVNRQNISKNFDFTDNYRSLQGDVFCKYGIGTDTLGINISKDIVNVDFTTIIKDNKVYISSNNPYINYNDVISISTQKRMRFGVGPMIGVGINHKLKFSPFIGIGVIYNVFKF